MKKTMNKKVDLRVIKTKKILFESLIKLMKNKSFEDLKVSDICNESLINRSTFYAHYNDKYELLVDFINSLKANLLEALDRNNNIVNTKEFYMEMIRLIINHIDAERENYYAIILSNRDNIITDIFVDVTIKDINKRLGINSLHLNDVPTDIFVTFYLGAVVSVLMAWLRGEGKYSKEDILTYLSKLIPDDIGE